MQQIGFRRQRENERCEYGQGPFGGVTVRRRVKNTLVGMGVRVAGWSVGGWEEVLDENRIRQDSYDNVWDGASKT